LASEGAEVAKNRSPRLSRVSGFLPGGQGGQNSSLTAVRPFSTRPTITGEA
jgi:hypothetical protein